MRIETRAFLGSFFFFLKEEISRSVHNQVLRIYHENPNQCIWNLRTVRETDIIPWSYILRTKSTVYWTPAVYQSLAASLIFPWTLWNSLVQVLNPRGIRGLLCTHKAVQRQSPGSDPAHLGSDVCLVSARLTWNNGEVLKDILRQ